MITISADFDEEIPLWDVALEALIREEYLKTGKRLAVDDIRRLSVSYAIRFDDIMATLFELTLHGKWSYRLPDDSVRPMTREDVDRLFVNGRLDAADVEGLVGAWQPSE